jgi:hypothetical protein
MSSYYTWAKRPDSDLLEPVAMVDDYFGQHRYGVMFNDGKVYPVSECEISVT